MQSPLLLLQSISKYIQLTIEEENFFLSLVQSKKIRKKQFVLQEGETDNSVKFVLSGLLRLYSVDKNGFEHIIQFAPNGWWIVDMYSFAKQQPARLFIDALENTELLWLSKNNLQKLYVEVPQLEHFFRVLAENSVITYQNRLISHLSWPAVERYKNFCAQYPSLIECLPQKQVASYIGVTPEFLSKMLSELKK